MIKGKIFKAFILTAGLLLGGQQAAHAEAKQLMCNSYSPFSTLFKNVCWSGIFPIRLAGTTFIQGKSGVPQDASNKIVCVCGGDLKKGTLPRIGFTVGFWSPAKIIDVTRNPYCLPSLGGVQLPLTSADFLNSGANMGRNGDKNIYFGNWALYSFPIIFMLRLIDEGACPPDGLTDFDLLQASPVYPNWNDNIGRYTTFINPEMLLFANVASMTALPVDAVSSTVFSKPINDFFWVAGSWGETYPLTGFADGSVVQHSIEPVRNSSLTAFRALSLMHRLGFLAETIGNSNLCERNLRYVVRKDAYRWQFLAPSPETAAPKNIPPATGGESSGADDEQVKEVNPPSIYNTCTHVTGASDVGWGMWRDVPATGEDHSYLLFQWTDCCFGVYGG